eukprot:TCONS_00034833-protein
MAIREDEELNIFQQILVLMENNDLVSLDLEQAGQSFEPHELKFLSKRVHISDISTRSCNFNEGNVAEFINIISAMKSCKVHFQMPEVHNYFFTVEDLEIMVEKNIQVVYISTVCLATNRRSSNLEQFVPVLKRMKHLDKVTLDGYYDDGPPPVHLFVDLPIYCLTTKHFKFEKNKMHEIVDTMSQIKELKSVELCWNRRGNYKLLPEDLLLFKHLPLTLIDPDILDLSEETVSDFRKVLDEMSSFSYLTSSFYKFESS